jgi:hypothetical protein
MRFFCSSKPSMAAVRMSFVSFVGIGVYVLFQMSGCVRK